MNSDNLSNLLVSVEIRNSLVGCPWNVGTLAISATNFLRSLSFFASRGFTSSRSVLLASVCVPPKGITDVR